MLVSLLLLLISICSLLHHTHCSTLNHYQEEEDSLLQNEYLNLDTHRKLESMLDVQSNRLSYQHSYWKSPSNGTDISNPMPGIKCINQTLCIEPALQLQKQYNVYMCKHIDYGVRFFYLIREGLLLHPNINLISDITQAELIVYLPGSSEWKKSECGMFKYMDRMIILDEGDGPELFFPPGLSGDEYRFNPDKKNNKLYYLTYFKRSYVKRENGIYKGVKAYAKHNQRDVFPMTYTILEAYINYHFIFRIHRSIDILCTLRGSKSFDPTRLRIRQWVEEYCIARGVKTCLAGEVNHASRTVISGGYFTQMSKAKLIVTSNPSDWEGDFRLMEAMASGALIFVDYMYVPRPNNLEQHKHIVYYNNNNKTDFFIQMDKYHTNSKRARRVAVAGYLHAMKYHRAVNLIDYVFRTTHLKLAMINKESFLPLYRETGYDMISQAVANDKYKV